MIKTCLVVAFYFGKRETCQESESKKYIDAQIHNLRKYKHNLTEVIFVIAQDDRLKTEIIKDDINDITYIYRKNQGLSFGSWMKTVKIFRDSFDYYIFLEDDYCFVKDNFDQILINEFNRINSYTNAMYVVTWYQSGAGKSTIGITSAKKLKKLNFFKNKKKKINFNHNKIKSMQQFLKYMSPYKTISHQYNAFPYWTGDGIFMFGAQNTESRESIMNRVIVCAFQMLDANYDINCNSPFLILSVPKSKSINGKNIWTNYIEK